MACVTPQSATIRLAATERAIGATSSYSWHSAAVARRSGSRPPHPLGMKLSMRLIMLLPRLQTMERNMIRLAIALAICIALAGCVGNQSVPVVSTPPHPSARDTKLAAEAVDAAERYCIENGVTPHTQHMTDCVTDNAHERLQKQDLDMFRAPPVVAAAPPVHYAPQMTAPLDVRGMDAGSAFAAGFAHGMGTPIASASPPAIQQPVTCTTPPTIPGGFVTTTCQ